VLGRKAEDMPIQILPRQDIILVKSHLVPYAEALSNGFRGAETEQGSGINV
jgi:hypothetical protein